MNVVLLFLQQTLDNTIHYFFQTELLHNLFSRGSEGIGGIIANITVIFVLLQIVL